MPVGVMPLLPQEVYLLGRRVEVRVQGVGGVQGKRRPLGDSWSERREDTCWIKRRFYNLSWRVLLEEKIKTSEGLQVKSSSRNGSASC